MGKGLKEPFIQRRYIQMVNKHMEWPSTSLIMKMQIKTIKRYYSTLISMATIKLQKTNVVEGVEKLKFLCVAGGNVK